MSETGDLIEVETNIYYLDPLGLGTHSVSGIYLVVADGITLIEAGTSLNAPHILEAVRSIGFKKSDIVRCIVTHVHLDHAGGTGWLARRVPHMQVHVHERGAKHLAEPSKLIQSAEMVYGNTETILDIHGEIVPVPRKNLVPVTNEEIDIGAGVRLKIFETPGHALHHICIFEPGTACLFSGEALGHYLPEFDMLTPAVAPPGFDLDASMETSGKIRNLNPRVICFSQFGQHRNATFVIDESERLLNDYAERIRYALGEGMSSGDIIEMMFSLLSREVSARNFSEQSLRGMLMSVVLGYCQYFQRTGLVP